MKKLLKIGELAKMSGLGAGAIRYYEKEGLLGKAERSAGNYRLYDSDAVERLRFIRHCRMQGLAMDEIKILLAYLQNPNGDCGAVHSLVDRHIAMIEEQIEHLQSLRSRLLAKRSENSCPDRGHCDIIRVFMKSDDCSFCKELKKWEDADKQAGDEH